MMKNSVFTLQFLLLCLLGCSQSKTVVTADYRDTKIAPRNLTVFLFPPTFQLTVDIAEDFGPGIPQDVYAKYFAKEFPDAMRRFAKVERVETDCSFARHSFVEKEFVIDDADTLRMRVPADGTTVRCDSLVPDVLLILTKMDIGWEPNSAVSPFSPSLPAAGVGPAGRLVHRLQFTVWDNMRHKPISYGRLKIESPIMGRLTKWNWDECLRGIASAVATRGSFELPADLEKPFAR